MIGSTMIGIGVAVAGISNVYKHYMAAKLSRLPKVTGHLLVKQNYVGDILRFHFPESKHSKWANKSWYLDGTDISGTACYGFTGGVIKSSFFVSQSEVPQIIVDYGMISGYKYRSTLGATPEDAVNIDGIVALAIMLSFCGSVVAASEYLGRKRDPPSQYQYVHSEAKYRTQSSFVPLRV